MRVIRANDAACRRGTNFTGTVWVEVLLPAEEPDNLGIYRVTFSPGARTYRHAHPGGQALNIVSGQGRVAREGEPPIEVGPGDTVFFGPGEVHWHGAAQECSMVHIAISIGGAAEWMAPVTDQEYAQAAQPPESLHHP
jgi:quercetin dioxygenase-like cupin family protein